ncbi:MAG: hypothetical protein O6761_06915 [Thaumarchaeota archaeon]|nr:hypothetical protein [Nitrososphaerota archaeon]
MTNTTIGDQQQANVENNSKAIFEDALGFTKRDDAINFASLSEGAAIVLVSSEADFPAPIGGFIRLGGQTQFKIIAPFTLTTPILLEAGGEVSIVTNFLSGNLINAFLAASSTLFQTLNIAVSIGSFADSTTEPGVKTTVTTLSAHGLTSDDKINISGVPTETAYNGNGQTISNVTATTFDIERVFTATDTGEVDTGPISFRDEVIFFDATGFPGSLKMFDLTFAVETGFAFASFNLAGAIANFNDFGIIRGADSCVIENSALLLNAVGLVLDNIESITISRSGPLSINPAGTATAITIQGAATARVNIVDYFPNLASALEFPIKINTDIDANARVTIRSSNAINPVTLVYFDTLGGGIDQTDVRVFLTDSAPAPNSQTIGAAFINENTATTVIAAPDTFQDINFGTLLASASMERFDLTDAIVAEFTYTGQNSMILPIIMSITVRKTGGATQNYIIKFLKDIGAGFVELDDDVHLPLELKTTNVGGTYNGEVKINPGDKIKPQIEGVSTDDDVIVDSVSITIK